MSIRITSDGTPAGTRIVDSATGEELELRRVEIVFDAINGIVAHLTDMNGMSTAGIESIRLGVPDVAAPVGRVENKGGSCPECGGTGKVQLFTSTRPCSRCGEA